MLSSLSMDVRRFVLASDFLDQLDYLVPAPILLDIRMAKIAGLQLLEILRQRAVRWPVIILTAHGDVGVAVRAMKLGAIAFLEKPFAPESLDHAIDQAFGILD
jgi:two-component system response regulator FixJ